MCPVGQGLESGEMHSISTIIAILLPTIPLRTLSGARSAILVTIHPPWLVPKAYAFPTPN